MGRQRFCGIAVLATWLCLAPSALAYVPTLSPQGIPVRWKGPVKLDLAGNSTNRCDLSPKDLFQAVVHGLERWSQASDGIVGFDYWQGTDPVVYEPDSAFNGLSSLYFTSNEKGGPSLSPNVLGLTQVWYDTKSGGILETDIALNDVNFNFTMNPRDTSGFGSEGSGAAVGNRPNVFVENVITHELGHALGLSHSGGLQSTMLYMESPEQAHIGCDEETAIRALYPASDAKERGAIAGSVESGSGVPVFGAHVVAISRRRGTVLATALTDPGGKFLMQALEPGAYFLMVEPFFAGAAPLPVYYAGIDDLVCPGSKLFGRTPLTDSTGYLLQTVDVVPGRTATAPRLLTRCSQVPGAAIGEISGASSSTSAPLVYDGTKPESGFGVADKIDSSGPHYYKLHMLSGDAEIHALAYSLYSPIHPSVRLLDSSGDPVNADVHDDSYEGDSGYVNYDSYLVAQGLAPGDYYLEISDTPLDASLYPAGPVSLDTQPFVLVTGSVNEGPPPLAESIPENARCREQEVFTPYSSPSGPPPRHGNSSQTTSGVGFCSSVAGLGAGAGTRKRNPSSGAIAGWLAPWLFMLLAARALAHLSRSRRLASQGGADYS